jgi:uncharacterized Zn-binding protein involved in type VI secretion
MASSYTSRILLELQADGENPNSWGDILNNNVIQLVDDAVAAYTSVTLSSTDYTLTTNDGATDQARSAMLEIVGTVSSDSNIIIPGVSKFYIVKDKSVRQNDAAIKIKTAAGSGFTVAASATRVVICDSVSVYGTDSFGATVCVTNLFSDNVFADRGNFEACVSITNLVAATGSFTTKVSGVAAEFSGAVCAATGSFSASVSTTNLVAATGSFTTKVSGVAAEFSGAVCATEFYGDGSALTNIDATLPRSYLAGLQLSNNSSDPDADIDIAVGTCRGSDNDEDITLSSAFTKKIDASWVAGSGNGGLASSLSLAANTWYHVHGINVGGASDVGFDTSPIAANLVSDHSATAFRRLGSILTDSSSDIFAFSQQGDEFLYNTSSTAFTTASNNTTEGSTISVTIAAPLSVRTWAMLNITGVDISNTQGILVHSPDVNIGIAKDVAQNSAFPGQTGAGQINSGSYVGGAFWTKVRTDTNSAISFSSPGTGSTRDFTFHTVGWWDTRGRDD